MKYSNFITDSIKILPHEMGEAGVTVCLKK
jgi:hypothetical protein